MHSEPHNQNNPCRTILIIEDDKDIRNALQLLIESENYNVFTAENGQEGLDQLSKIPRPCLVLLDLMMPVMNGMAFLEAVDSQVILSTLPIVVLTAYSDRAKEMKKSRTVLKKPVDTEILFKIIKQYCG